MITKSFFFNVDGVQILFDK